MRSVINKPYDALLPAPFGRLGVRTHGEAITKIDFLPGDGAVATAHHQCTAVDLLQQALAAYWQDPFASLVHVPRVLYGTDHQLRVWQALDEIACGHSRTYSELAAELGSCARAVGQACGANPLPLLIPCHRVVARSGIGGFMHHRQGQAIGIKMWLLAHETAR